MENVFDDDLDDSWMGEIPEEETRGDDEPGQDHLKVLHERFGHKSFKPLQWDIIRSAINDKLDQCLVMATGYGKSLCYQVRS
jgi:werner syndrome ATP-dependent helicase